MRSRLLDTAAALLLLLGAAVASAAQDIRAVAVFPVDNLSGVAAPVEAVRQVVAETLASRGVSVLEAGALDDFMRRHRIRYAGGVDAATADLLRQETGADGVVFLAITLSSESFPPKIALIARLVSTRDTPLVVWSSDVSMAGDDAPGWFELGVIGDYGTLVARALGRLTASLANYLETGAPGAEPKSASKFRPKMFYRAEGLEPARAASIAVLPFLNLSARRNAGDILGLLYARHLAAVPGLRVFDAGVVRRELLSARIIMDAGPSITDAETVAALVEADFVLGGRVLVFEDFEGGEGTAHVEFSTVIIERKTRKVVWSSDSYNSGRDGVLFFERGRTRTAQLMATQMVRLTTEKIAGDGK